MRLAEELVGQQSAGAAAFVAVTEAAPTFKEETTQLAEHAAVQARPGMKAGARCAEAWAMAASIAVEWDNVMLTTAEDAAHQAVALLQDQSIDVAMVGSTTRAFLGLYRAFTDLVATADDTTMVVVYVVGMVVPQEEVGDASDKIEALFGNDDGVSVSMMTDEQVALLMSFKTAHH
jgi:hypothetical protein